MISSKGYYALSHDALRAHAPSVFADRPYDKVSEKYGFISTIDVLDRLADEGFMPVAANESRTRIDAKRGFLKHSLRLRRREDIGSLAKQIGDVFPEVILTNSHDGSSTHVLEGGLFRLFCSNGMALPMEGYQKLTVRHTGNVAGEILDGCIKVIDDATRFAHEAQEWQKIELDKQEQLLLADHALQLRWAKDEAGKSTAPIFPAQLLVARRPQDTANDLWHVTNRLQENLSKGGLRGVGSTGRRTSTRAVTAVDADLKLNRQLMTLADEFAKLKAA